MHPNAPLLPYSPHSCSQSALFLSPESKVMWFNKYVLKEWAWSSSWSLAVGVPANIWYFPDAAASLSVEYFLTPSFELHLFSNLVSTSWLLYSGHHRGQSAVSCIWAHFPRSCFSPMYVSPSRLQAFPFCLIPLSTVLCQDISLDEKPLHILIPLLWCFFSQLSH